MSGGEYGSPLHKVSEFGHELVVKLLLEKGADVNMSSGKYGSALGAASYLGRESLVQLLLDNGAEVNVSGGEYGSPLHMASYSGCESLVQLLLEKGAEVNMPAEAQKTALMIVAARNQKEILKTLLTSGADPGREDSLQRSALYWASCNEDSDSLDMIIEAIRSRPYAKAHLGSALHQTVARNHLDNLSKLLKEDVDLDCFNRNGWSPLYCARQCRLKNIEEMLITAGAVDEAPTLRHPSGWEESDKAACLTVLDNGRAVIVGGKQHWTSRPISFEVASAHQLTESNINSYNEIDSMGSIRANHCMPQYLGAGPGHGVYYFEVEILKGGESK